MTVAVCAHRGGGESAPLSTLAAYVDAVAAGVDYVEFDVRRTRDHQLVAFHNSRVGRRRVHPGQLTRRELDSAAGIAVPGIDEILAITAGHAKALVDVKEPGYEADIVAQVAAAMPAADVIVTGTDAVVAAVKRDFPQIRTALSLGRGWTEIPPLRTIQTRWSEARPLRRVRACGADAIAVHYRLARLGALATCARHGIGVLVWTVNNPAMIRSYVADERVEILVTDRPRLAMRARAEVS